jgi:Raf kinase inhibitor-like YbhB/YbcL family protein
MAKLFLLLLIILTVAFFFSKKLFMKNPNDLSYIPNNMSLTSTDFSDQGSIPIRFTCQDDNVNPILHISGTPENAESLVLIVDDPDANGGVWYHWLMWDINPLVTEIQSEASPGVQGNNDFGRNKYNGPCPPLGTHRYFFRLYALNTILDLPPETKAPQLIKAIKNHILDKAELMGKFQKE